MTMGLVSVVILLAALIGAPYERRAWGSWIDADRDCQDTRTEVLLEESLVPVTFADARHCTVAAGAWRDPYTGRVYGSPRALDIDHLVPLAEAHRSGGGRWSRTHKRAYANDLTDSGHLVVVAAAVNRAKGAQTPASWRPPDRGAWCDYARAWVRIKQRWRLTISREERRAIAAMRAGCPA